MKVQGIAVIVVALVVIGSTLHTYQVITHPAYWTLYGAVFGFIVGTLKRKTTVSRFRNEIFLNR